MTVSQLVLQNTRSLLVLHFAHLKLLIYTFHNN